MYRLRVLVNGRPIPVYTDRQGNNWIEARYGTEYEIKVENKTYKRVLAVVSTDGLNVINAKHEDPTHSPGYVVEGNGSIRIPGWLVNSNEVRKFTFEQEGNTYSEKIGTSVQNIGVIGCAIFEEKPQMKYSVYGPDSQWWYDWHWTPGWDWNPATYTSSNIPYKSSSTGAEKSTVRSMNVTSSVNTTPSQEIGTGSGAKQDFSTYEVNFERGKMHLLSLYYDTRENLIEKGIIIEDNKPKPFPVVPGYAPDV